ncbi:uncharacterized protein KZ484_008752 [Pholidichthys leucotaenia]
MTPQAIQQLKSNEVGSSNAMEKEGFICSMDLLEEHGLAVDAIITDRQPQIQKHMREKMPDVRHYYDVWHVAKAGSRSAFTASKPDPSRPNWLRVGLAFGTSAFLWGLLFKQHSDDVHEYKARSPRQQTPLSTAEMFPAERPGRGGGPWPARQPPGSPRDGEVTFSADLNTSCTVIVPALVGLRVQLLRWYSLSSVEESCAGIQHHVSQVVQRRPMSSVPGGTGENIMYTVLCGGCFVFALTYAYKTVISDQIRYAERLAELNSRPKKEWVPKPWPPKRKDEDGEEEEAAGVVEEAAEVVEEAAEVVEEAAEVVEEAAEVVEEAAEAVAEAAQEVEAVAEEVAQVAEVVEEAAKAVLESGSNVLMAEASTLDVTGMAEVKEELAPSIDGVKDETTEAKTAEETEVASQPVERALREQEETATSVESTLTEESPAEEPSPVIVTPPEEAVTEAPGPIETAPVTDTAVEENVAPTPLEEALSIPEEAPAPVEEVAVVAQELIAPVEEVTLEASAPVEEVAPVAREVPSSVEEIAPFAQEVPSLVEEAAQEDPAPVEEVASVPQKALAPVIEEAVPLVEEVAIAAVSEVAEDIAPAPVEVVASVAEEVASAPAVEEAPAPIAEVASAEETSAPVVEEALTPVEVEAAAALAEERVGATVVEEAVVVPAAEVSSPVAEEAAVMPTQIQSEDPKKEYIVVVLEGTPKEEKRPKVLGVGPMTGRIIATPKEDAPVSEGKRRLVRMQMQ